MKSKAALFFLIFLIVTWVNAQNPRKFHKAQKILDKATKAGLVGVALHIDHPRWGSQTVTSGFADRETSEPLEKDHIFSLASVGKTYTATTVMLLVQQGRLKPDDAISKYLSDEIVDNLPLGHSVTIRHLLNMTSGFYNYEQHPVLNQLYLDRKLSLDTLSHLEALQRYAYGQPATAAPGKEVHYSSTNYMLLAMIMDTILGEYHDHYMEQTIFAPLKLRSTSYRKSPERWLSSAYGDINDNGRLENITPMAIETTNWFIGDDGVYANAEEACRFMKALLTGQITNQQTLKEMTTWVEDQYGMGLMYDKAFPYKEVIGHTGRGIGSTTDVHYFPRQGITLALLCNTGKRVGDPQFGKAYNRLRKRIVKLLFL